MVYVTWHPLELGFVTGDASTVFQPSEVLCAETVARQSSWKGLAVLQDLVSPRVPSPAAGPPLTSGNCILCRENTACAISKASSQTSKQTTGEHSGPLSETVVPSDVPA